MGRQAHAFGNPEDIYKSVRVASKQVHGCGSSYKKKLQCNAGDQSALRAVSQECNQIIGYGTLLAGYQSQGLMDSFRRVSWSLGSAISSLDKDKIPYQWPEAD